MTNLNAFAVLLDIDQRCRSHAKGLPTGIQVEEDWVGIGFSLLGKRLVAKMSDVTEILPTPSTIRIPGVSSWVGGLANIRGTLMPILNLREYLSGVVAMANTDNRVLVIDKDGVVAGLLVDEVYGLRRFKPENIQNSTDLDMGSVEPYLEGSFLEGNQVWNIFSIKELVSNQRFLKVV